MRYTGSGTPADVWHCTNHNHIIYVKQGKEHTLQGRVAFDRWFPYPKE